MSEQINLQLKHDENDCPTDMILRIGLQAFAVNPFRNLKYNANFMPDIQAPVTPQTIKPMELPSMEPQQLQELIDFCEYFGWTATIVHESSTFVVRFLENVPPYYPNTTTFISFILNQHSYEFILSNLYGMASDVTEPYGCTTP